MPFSTPLFLLHSAPQEPPVNYPVLHSEIVSVGPFALRWYGLAYLAGFFCALWLGRRQARRLAGWNDQAVSDLIFYGALGVILGGRVGYVLFYGLYQQHESSWWIFKVWEGGMSSHGGMLGVTIAMWLFARNTGRRLFEVGDFTAPLVPAGLLFGRLANFVNTELPGRVTDVPWALHYPCDALQGLQPICVNGYEIVARHPSPLYQAGCEGLVLGVLLWWYVAKPRPLATVSGLFLIGYGVLREFTESFRQPDANLGFVIGHVSMGQLLSLPLILAGVALFAWGWAKEQPPRLVAA